VGDLLLRESEFDIRECKHCLWAFGGIGILIRAGRIEAIRAFPEWPQGADVFAVSTNGELIPQPDWFEGPPLQVNVQGGSRIRLLLNDEARAAAGSI
jgi:hypothetical protein